MLSSQSNDFQISDLRPDAKIGTGTDQEYAKVRVLFTLNSYAQLRFFKDLREGMLVRDEGVVGSNPATPTKKSFQIKRRLVLILCAGVEMVRDKSWTSCRLPVT